MIRPNSTPADASYGSDFPQRTRTEALPGAARLNYLFSRNRTLCNRSLDAIRARTHKSSLIGAADRCPLCPDSAQIP